MLTSSGPVDPAPPLSTSMKPALLSLLSLFFLSACQVPSSISKSTATMPLGSELKVALPPLIVGLEAPTWEDVQPVEENAPSWSKPVNDTYTRVSTGRKVVAITFDDGPHP